MAVYLDHAAGTSLRPASAATLVAALGAVGNPSSVHRHGQAARAMLEEARERLAAAVGCESIEVLFTSGGTEAVNLAITGAWRAGGGGALLVPGGEHAATTSSAEALEREGARIVHLPVDADARLDPGALAAALDATPDAALITVLAANNEVGSVNDIAALAAVARARSVTLHVDAIAAFGSVPLRFDAVGADLMSVSSVKIGGPAGVGALLAGRSATVSPLLHGGGQERGLRSGTPSAPLALAFAVAAEEALGGLAEESRRIARLRDRALAGLLDALPGSVLRGAPPGPGRLPGNLHVTVEGADGESLLFLLDGAGVSVSTGSACLAGVTRISPVLLAMGVPAAEAGGALRITFGHSSTEADVDALLAALPALAPAIAQRPPGRGLSPLWAHS